MGSSLLLWRLTGWLFFFSEIATTCPRITNEQLFNAQLMCPACFNDTFENFWYHHRPCYDFYLVLQTPTYPCSNCSLTFLYMFHRYLMLFNFKYVLFFLIQYTRENAQILKCCWFICVYHTFSFLTKVFWCNSFEYSPLFTRYLIPPTSNLLVIFFITIIPLNNK